MRSSSIFFLLNISCIFAIPLDYANYNNNDENSLGEWAPEELEEPVEQIDLFKTERPLGQVSGLAVNANGHVVAFHRGDRVWDENSFNADETFSKSLAPITNKTIVIMDKSGKIVDEFGDNQFYMPHGLTIDKSGNYWVTDVGAHQVHKIDAATKTIVMSLGEKMVPGEDQQHFCKPTDVAVASNGHFFVADGYCNSRILKFDKDGKVLAEISAAVEPNQPTDFVVPHSIALIEDLNIICVADRENERVQCFSAGLAEGERKLPTGIPITSANDIGRVYAIREKEHQLMGVTGSSADVEAQMFTIAVQTGETHTFAKGIENAHALAISNDGSVYVSQLSPSRILKISPY